MKIHLEAPELTDKGVTATLHPTRKEAHLSWQAEPHGVDAVTVGEHMMFMPERSWRHRNFLRHLGHDIAEPA